MKKASFSEILRVIITFAWLLYGFVVLYSVSVFKTMRSILWLMGVDF